MLLKIYMRIEHWTSEFNETNTQKVKVPIKPSHGFPLISTLWKPKANYLEKLSQLWMCVNKNEPQRMWRGGNKQGVLTLCFSRVWCRAWGLGSTHSCVLYCINPHGTWPAVLTAPKEVVWLFLDIVASVNVSFAVSLATATSQAALSLSGIPVPLWIIIRVCDEHQNVFLLKPGCCTMLPLGLYG